jgi:hypothetical protein
MQQARHGEVVHVAGTAGDFVAAFLARDRGTNDGLVRPHDGQVKAAAIMLQSIIILLDIVAEAAGNLNVKL